MTNHVFFCMSSVCLAKTFLFGIERQRIPNQVFTAIQGSTITGIGNLGTPAVGKLQIPPGHCLWESCLWLQEACNVFWDL